MRSMVAVVVVAAMALVVPGFAGAETTLEPSEQRFYMRNSGTGCPGETFLSTQPGAGEPGCGFVGGAPIGELHRTGISNLGNGIRIYDTAGGTAVQVLDATRDVAGNVRVVSTATTNRMAVGQVRVDVTVTGRGTNNSQVTLGSHSSEQLVNPTNSAEIDFPFTIDTPDDLDATELKDLTVTVEIRGWHLLTGYLRLNGESWMDLPNYTVVATG